MREFNGTLIKTGTDSCRLAGSGRERSLPPTLPPPADKSCCSLGNSIA